MGFESLIGSRVSLRAVRDGDLEAIEVWLEEAVAAAGSPHPRPLSCLAGEGRPVDPRAGSVLVIESMGDDDGPIGLVEYAVSDGWLAVAFIALTKAYRGWGYGSEAIRLLEEWALRRRTAEQFRAEVNARNGLGLYFWLRLGYRPAGRDEFGWRREGERDRMTMVRVARERVARDKR